MTKQATPYKYNSTVNVIGSIPDYSSMIDYIIDKYNSECGNSSFNFRTSKATTRFKKAVCDGFLSFRSDQHKELFLGALSSEDFPASSELLDHISKRPLSAEQPSLEFERLSQKNYDWEEYCVQNNVNPIEAWYQFRHAEVLPPQRTQVLAFELITDVVRTLLDKDDDGVMPLVDRTGEGLVADRIATLAQSNDPSAQSEAADIRAQLRELADFTDRLDALLASGYDPKLDDGVGKNIAPLQKAGLLSYAVLKETGGKKSQLNKYLNAEW